MRHKVYSFINIAGLAVGMACTILILILIQYKDKQFFEDDIFMADDTVFNIFTFPLIKGDPQDALKRAYSIVITEDMAQKYFGDEDPIGRVIKADNKILTKRSLASLEIII